MNAWFNSLISCNTASLPNDIAIMILSVGQSNENGRADADRLIITTWPTRPVNTFYYIKTDYTSTDNGFFRSFQTGGPNAEEPDESGRRYFSQDAILASKLRALFGNDTPIYLVNAAEGGTFIVPFPGANRDWQKVTNECYDRALNGMFLPALADIQAAHPTRTVKVIKLFQQGESEAIQGGTYVTNYPTNLSQFISDFDSESPFLSSAPWLFTKLYFNADANEATINGYLQTFVNASPSSRFIVDISSKPRKVDLTTEQKAGTTQGTDDQHTSYVGQEYKANQHYPNILSFMQWPNNDISEITNNTNFSADSYLQPTKTGFRLQLNRGNMTITAPGGTPGAENTITAVTENFFAHTFTKAGTSTLRLKNQARKGCAWFPPGTSVGDGRLVSATSLPNALFNSGSFVWTIGGYAKFAPNTGSGGNPDQCLLSTTDVYSGTRSRILVYKTSAGKLRIDVNCNSSTTKSALTNNVVFNATANEGDTQFIHWAITSDGSNMKIFINGVDQALDAVSNGSFSGIIPTNFNNSTNGIVIGQRQTAASTFDFGFMGEMREVFGFATIALNSTQIGNLMLN